MQLAEMQKKREETGVIPAGEPLKWVLRFERDEQLAAVYISLGASGKKYGNDSAVSHGGLPLH
jgi:hypothetical protein